ncbi:protein SCO1/2 [Marinospirillum celere]|uniref:Protein SCO1/2 n=1 Tax=Marinospirillum celere TaxID=1122252 RepID=A0A1I1EFG0_9GAMM|nr:SCO family protein [Marinospirillum celere]SFB85312.1 protein SCO1/2 [Marinospirillum celere]
MKTNKTLLLGGVAVIALIAAVQIWSGLNQQPEQTALAEKPTGAPFTLQSKEGEVSLSDLEDNQLALIFFGYTWCPDICPMSMVFLSRALENLPGDVRDRVQPIFISVDPDRDTPERLQAYVEFFDAGILGVTGDKDYLQQLASEYGAFYRKVEMDSAMEYAVDHTSDFYLATNKGELITTLSHNVSGNQLNETLTKALAEIQ